MKKNTTATLKNLLNMLGKLVVIALAFVTIALFFCKSDEMRSMIFSPAGVGVICLAIGGASGFFAGYIKCMFEANAAIEKLTSACKERDAKLAKYRRSLNDHKQLLAKYANYYSKKEYESRLTSCEKFMAEIEHFPIAPDASETPVEVIDTFDEDTSDSDEES